MGDDARRARIGPLVEAPSTRDPERPGAPGQSGGHACLESI